MLINVFMQNRLRNPTMGGGYPQQGYQARPPTWGPPGGPMQQPGYGYGQPGAYSGQAPQYNMSQPPYGGYSQPTSGGYPSNWDQPTVPPAPQTSQGAGYDYYNQQQPVQSQQTPGGTAHPADNSGYNYSQPPASGYSQSGQGYPQDGYGGYHAPPPQSGYGQGPTQSGYGQPPYDQHQGYSAAGYGAATSTAQEGHTSTYGSQVESVQAPTTVPPSGGQQGYSASQKPSPSSVSYSSQGSVQPGYGVPPTSQAGYGSLPPAQGGYGSAYGPPPTQNPVNPPAYGQQPHQSPSTSAGYGQPPLQSGYGQPTGYAQPDSGAQRPPPSSYGAGATQAGYDPSYGTPPATQSGYGQAPPPYGSYGSGYSQPQAYISDGSAAGNIPGSQTVQQGSVAKTSPQS